MAPGARREDLARLLAAYRDGLGLVGVAVIGAPATVRLEVVESRGFCRNGEAETVAAVFWCRRRADAECVAEAAARRLRRAKTQACGCDEQPAAAAAGAGAAIVGAATRLNIALYSEAAIDAEAAALARRIDAEIAKLNRSGGLKSINKSYRDYRLNATARGERVLRYRDWMCRYRENLLRQLAATLRYL